MVVFFILKPLFSGDLSLGRVVSSLVSLGVIAYAVYVINQIQKTGRSNEQLTTSEKWKVILTEIFGSVVVWTLYYYSLRKDFPKKASQANKYGWIITGIQILLFIGVAYIIIKYFPQLLPAKSH